MTPNKPKPAIPRIILILGALLPIAAALGASARYVKGVADDTYVRRDSFALTHKTDSLVQDARAARSESMLNTLVRACQRRGDCP